MVVKSDGDWTFVGFPVDQEQVNARHLAALENAALEVEHGDSLLQEKSIADEMMGLQSSDNTAGNLNSGTVDFLSDAYGVGQNLSGQELTFCDEYVPESQYSPSEITQPSIGCDVPSTIEGYSAANVFGLARSQLRHEGIKHFWETGFWNDFFDPSKDFLCSFDSNFKRPVDPTHEFDAGEVSEPLTRKQKTVKLAATFMDHVRTTTVMTWKEQREAEWQTAIHRWHAMPGVWTKSVQIVEQIFSRTGFSAQAQVLVDISHNRAPATIMKRCRSMSRLTNFFIDRGRTFPCDESQFYEFLCVERENGAPPSRLKGFIEAVTFCRHVLGVLEFDGFTLSRRCQGVAALDVSHKIQQAEPLSVKQLEVLHHVLFTDTEIWNRVFAGMLLFCVYARSRWSDAQHGEHLLEDHDENGEHAYIEVATGVHKTAKALQLRHLYLPLVAPCTGVVAGNWGAEWCECRRKLGIHELKSFPLMPAPNAEQEPTERPLSSTEAGSWMRALLSVDVTNKQIRFSSHSLKATCLSFAAKRGCSFEDRLSLGYHTHSLKMALVYSRDGASRPLRVLESMLKEIREKVFNPNDTRSGRLRGLPSLSTEGLLSQSTEHDASAVAKPPMDAHAEPDTVKTEVRDVEEFTVSEHATTGSATDSGVETTVRPKVSFRDITAPEGTVLHQHCKWKTLHIMKAENRVVFLCGRKTGSMYKVAQMRHAFDTPKCRQCFHAKLD